MANVLIEQNTMDDIADAIRSKNGSSSTYKPAQMPAAISNLSPAPSLQSKSVSYTPTESAQSATVTADSGYDGLSSVGVSVGAISSTYVGSGITRQTAATVEDGILDFLEDENAIIIPDGYYDDVVSIELNSVFPPNPTISVSNSGLITASYNISSGYLNTNNASMPHSATQQLTTKAATTYTPSTTTQTISANQYLTGIQTINPIPSEYIVPSGDLSITSNGTVNVANYATATVNVSGGGGQSINVQVAAGVNRVASSSYTAVSGQSITVDVTGTYDVYWTGYRSSTSGTSGSQLYIDSTAYGSAQTTFSNHGQAIHLTNVSLTKDQVVTVRARARSSSYYMYVGNLTIVQTS